MAAFLEFEIEADNLKAFLSLEEKDKFAGLKITFDPQKETHSLVFERIPKLNNELEEGKVIVHSPHYAVGTFSDGVEETITLKKNNAGDYELDKKNSNWRLLKTKKIAFSNLITKFDFAIFTPDVMTDVLTKENLKSVTFFGISFSLGLNEQFKDAIPYKPYFSFGLRANISQLRLDKNGINYLGVKIITDLNENDEVASLIYLAGVCPPGWHPVP